MSLQKIRGVKNYRALDQGLRVLGASNEIGGAVLDVAQGVAASANSMGDAEYNAVPQSVRIGWNNESRAGAAVQVTKPHWRDARDALLIRLVKAMAR